MLCCVRDMCAVLCEGGTIHAYDATHMSRVQVTHLRFLCELTHVQ